MKAKYVAVQLQRDDNGDLWIMVPNAGFNMTALGASTSIIQQKFRQWAESELQGEQPQRKEQP